MNNQFYLLQEAIHFNLVNLKSYNFVLDLDGVRKYNISNRNTILLQKKAADALIKAKNLLPNKYNFIIKYGYRTFEDQLDLIQKTEKEFKKQYSNNWEEQLNKYTGGYEELEELKKTSNISRMNHLSGYAVDLSIVDENENELDMGGWRGNKQDSLDYNINPKITKNRKLLKFSLSKNGFKNHLLEWWHWGYIK